MESQDTQTKSKFPLAITVTIISVIGSIVVALIAKWPSSSTPKIVQNDTSQILKKSISEDLSFCDKIKLALEDVPLKFKNFKGPVTKETANEIYYQSNYVFDSLKSNLVYYKPDKVIVLELEIYNGEDSIRAKDFMHTYTTILDACLTTKNKQEPLHGDSELGQLFFQDYLSEDTEVEIKMTLNKISHVIISIEKNDE